MVALRLSRANVELGGSKRSVDLEHRLVYQNHVERRHGDHEFVGRACGRRCPIETSHTWFTCHSQVHGRADKVLHCSQGWINHTVDAWVSLFDLC